MARKISIPLKTTWCGWLVFGAASALAGTPALQGQSGYINMPNAQVDVDGTFATGYSYDSPYGSLWATSTIFPFLQVTGRYVSINGIPGFTNAENQYGSGYGRYKDKVFDAKLQLLSENSWRPAIAVGATDLEGTELFKGQYVVASKTFGKAGNIEASIGYGNRRPKGLFAGARYGFLSAPHWAMVAEYDANDYKNDFRAAETSAAKRRNGPAVGLEYRWGWLTAQVARNRDHFSANGSISIPFWQREFIPKLLEPAPFQAKDAPPQVSSSEWQDNPRHAAALVEALARQDFKNIRVQLDSGTLGLTLTNGRIANTGRAVGRAVRTALAFAPQGTRAIRVTYTRLEQPIATYEFNDLQRLSDYLTGLVNRDSFSQTVLVRQATPADTIAGEHELFGAIREDDAVGIRVGRDGDMVQVSSEDSEANRFKIVPKTSFFFNDPSGALRYELWAATNYDKRLGQGLYLNSDFKLTLLENVSSVTQPSNSLLPHVRTDIAEYKRGGRFKLNRMLLNKYATPYEGVYVRASAGFYEEMFRGVGGQALYVPKDTRWAADISVDALQQRGYKGWFDKRDYQTVTALGALHYKLPYDVTVTARAGRFLARDEGVRLEFKRRFRSGVEIGAWYARTNGNDITNPGSPASPYHDKGVFLSVPLNIMLPLDSQATASIALAPWTRDVGQMVATPGDLYELTERPRRDMNTYDGLGNFAERRDEQNLAAVNPPVRGLDNPWPAFRMRVEQAATNTPSFPQWTGWAVAGGGAILASSLLDKPVDRFMKKHEDASITRAYANVGKAAPVLAVGAAGAALAFGNGRMQNIGLISLESAASAALLSMGAKHIAGRARPSEERGHWARSSDRSDASFPSNHAAVTFAAVTPFAQEYDAPWLYGVAAVASAGRTANRQHWVSDVVAGGLLGAAVGGWLWQGQRENNTSGFAIAPGHKEISVAWRGTY